MPSSLKGRRSNASFSLFDTRSLSLNDIREIFDIASDFDVNFTVAARAKVVCCLFFEPSTRTRMSFQTAAYRLGHQVLTMELSTGSSLSKGETPVDTVLNVAAMKPDVLVVRYGLSRELDELLPTLDIPVINAGSGTLAHPTQALLDAYTIEREMNGVEGKRVLIVGDIRHSRVARSNFDVLAKLGAKIGVCGPESLLPDADGDMPAGTRVFTNLDEAVGWCDVYMGLRIQLERHTARDLQLESIEDYHRHFGLNRERLKKLGAGALIMHPGPINHGVEFSTEVVADPRSRILKQVTNGVLIRAALLSKTLRGNERGGKK
ncbi:MAG: aspartate carbamoyltransferase catalytic subunit [Bdellovibrionota bacterium]